MQVTQFQNGSWWKTRLRSRAYLVQAIWQVDLLAGPLLALGTMYGKHQVLAAWAKGPDRTFCRNKLILKTEGLVGLPTRHDQLGCDHLRSQVLGGPNRTNASSFIPDARREKASIRSLRIRGVAASWMLLRSVTSRQFNAGYRDFRIMRYSKHRFRMPQDCFRAAPAIRCDPIR